ncbi:hypothetical protein [Streptomyces sp. NPDC015131]
MTRNEDRAAMGCLGTFFLLYLAGAGVALWGLIELVLWITSK